MKTLTRISQVIVIATLIMIVLPWLFLSKVPPGMIGVRQSATSGVDKQDLGPGFHWRIPGVHKVILLPRGYFFLNYTEDPSDQGEALLVRTKDNNNVSLDVTVPVRIKPGEANLIVSAGNHARDGDRFRYQRLAAETTVSVLREELANLDSDRLDLTPEWREEVLGFKTNGHQAGLVRAAVM